MKLLIALLITFFFVFIIFIIKAKECEKEIDNIKEPEY